MTKKTYIAVAKIIKSNSMNGGQTQMIPMINKIAFITALGTMFKEDNNNFDYHRFIDACYDDDE